MQKTLSTKEQDLCSYAGTFGALLTATCFVQHVIIMREHWVTYSMMGIYLLAIIAFILLAVQKTIAPVLLIICATLLLLLGAVWIASGLYSIVVILLFIYTTVIAILLFMEGIPAKLKEKARAAKAEQMEWENKI